MEDRVKFKVEYLYPLKGKKYSALRHLANHFIHPFKYRKEFKKNCIKHVMFAEEAFMLNFLPSRMTVVSCLDVIPLVLPHEASSKYRMFLKWAYKGMKRADRIIANSTYTKKDIVKHLQIPENKISVAYPPIQERFKPEEEAPESFLNIHGLQKNKKYLLSVGALDLPRKNLRTVLEAFALFHKENKRVHLLLIGYTTLKGSLDDLHDQIKQLGIGDAVHIITNVPDEELVAFYNLADIFLFPSLYEGFGLPPLEAMACGTPVIASHVASIPEVLGDACVYVDPLDSEEIARQIEMLMLNKQLCEEKIASGLKQAAKYTWQRYCDATYEVYKEVWGKRS